MAETFAKVLLLFKLKGQMRIMCISLKLVGWLPVMAYKTETENKMFGTKKQWLNIYQCDFSSRISFRFQVQFSFQMNYKIVNELIEPINRLQ